MSETLLTICIPTYNRAAVLDKGLEKLLAEYRRTEKKHLLELIVSNNCSADHTEEVVQKYINLGLPITYNLNEKNLGMDGNFVKCFKLATSKYVWLLGDDDYLIEGSLEKLLNLIMINDYGLIHLKVKDGHATLASCEYDDHKKFLSDVTYWITFISSNIVATKFVPEIDFEKYMGTYFTLVPLYLTAAKNSGKNLIVHQQILEIGKDFETNGGYNYFEVFVNNYLAIRREFYGGDLKSYETEKEKVFKGHILPFVVRLLIMRHKGNYSTTGGWGILLKNYGKNAYFYIGLLRAVLRLMIDIFKISIYKLQTIFHKSQDI